MSRAADSERVVRHVVALRRVGEAVSDPREQKRLLHVERELRRGVGVGIPKLRAAAVLGISLTALDRWIALGKLPVVRRPGSSRHEVDAAALFTLATEVSRIREEGSGRNPVGTALRRLEAECRPLRKLRPNQSACELRGDAERTTPLDRLRQANDLSHALSMLALRGAEARRRARAAGADPEGLR